MKNNNKDNQLALETYLMIKNQQTFQLYLIYPSCCTSGSPTVRRCKRRPQSGEFRRHRPSSTTCDSGSSQSGETNLGKLTQIGKA